MPYCDECGNEVSITDKRCSKCGNKLSPVPGPEDIFAKIKRFFSPEPYHNIEFIIAIIAVIFTVLMIPNSINGFSLSSSNIFIYILIALLVAVIGAIIIRYYAKIGAILILFAAFSLILFGIQGMFFALIFYIIAAILAFIR